ncbi:hypothetical protein KCV05_g97, partial [Aureobasidium melanogenum]
MRGFGLLLLPVVAKLASAQSQYTINVTAVPEATRDTWCTNQQNACPLICLQTAANSSDTIENDCDPDTLDYSCICANNVAPNASEYSQTIPYYICTEWGTECISGCGGNTTTAEPNTLAVLRTPPASTSHPPLPRQQPQRLPRTKARPQTLPARPSTLVLVVALGQAYGLFAVTAGIFGGFALLLLPFFFLRIFALISHSFLYLFPDLAFSPGTADLFPPRGFCSSVSSSRDSRSALIHLKVLTSPCLKTDMLYRYDERRPEITNRAEDSQIEPSMYASPERAGLRSGSGSLVKVRCVKLLSDCIDTGQLCLFAGLDLGGNSLLELVHVVGYTVLLGVAFWQTHLLELELTVLELFLSKDDGKGNAVGLGSLELRRQLRLDFPAEFGLDAGIP